MYHRTPNRAGLGARTPALTGPLSLVADFKLDGAVYGSPIVVDGRTFVATENDSVYSFDGAYRQIWKRTLGKPSPQSERPCGNIDPLGITSTPIAANGVLYVVAEFGGDVRHEMFAIDQRTGAVRWHRSVDLPGPDPTVMQQRGALAITGSRVWAPFGALAGDCGNYKGRVVGVRLDGTGDVVKYDPSTREQGGMWNAAGPTVGQQGHLYVVSANGSSGPGDDYDHTNSVDELDENGTLVDSFAPSDWAQNNAGDVGLGSQGVALVGTKWAVLGGKSGPVYVLRQGRLGGIGGQVSMLNFCKSYGGAAVDGNVIYFPCVDGVRAARVDDDGRLQVLWHVDDNDVSGSPVVAGGRVWVMDQSGGVLHALDPSTGKSTAQVHVGQTNRFASPSITGPDILVSTMSGLSVVRAS
jgi:outer membrane protein assembly factor BamB